MGSARPSRQPVLAPAIRMIPRARNFGKKNPLCFQDGSPAWPGKISVKFITFAPKQGTHASAGLAPGLVRGGARWGAWAQ